MKPLAVILPLVAACFAAPAQQTTPPAQAPPPNQNQPAQQPSGSLTKVLNESAPPLPSPATPATAPVTAQTSLATVALEGVSLSGALSVDNGLAFIGNNGAVTAGDRTARVSLTRGGNLNVCPSTTIHLSTDNTMSGGGLMVAFDQGALEAHYLPGQYSDVILTPDLRILISAPGQADLSIGVTRQGDTCINNLGDHAPYVLASNLFEGGAYRVQPNERVLFVRGSLEHAVDNDKQTCGCPAPHPTPTPTTIVGVGAMGGTLRSETQPAPPPPAEQNTTAAQNPFPLTESAGIKPPPAPANTPVVPPGEAHTQVTVPLVYNGEAPPNAGSPDSPPPSSPPANPGSAAQPAADAACQDPLFPGVVCDSNAAVNQTTPQGEQGAAPAPAAEPSASPADENASPKKKHSGFVRFLHKIFG